MRISKSVLVGFTIAAAAAGAGLYFQYVAGKASPIGLLRPGDSAIVAAGKTTYATNCASCHGANLEGEPNWRKPNPDLTMPAPPHSKRGHTWHHADQILFDLTKYGVAKFIKQGSYKSNMPAYEGVLSDDEIIAVLSYIKSTWPKDVQDRHNQLNAQVEKAEK